MKALEIKQNKKEQNFTLFIDYIKEFIPRCRRTRRTKLGYGSTKNILIDYDNETRSKLHFESIEMAFNNAF